MAGNETGPGEGGGWSAPDSLRAAVYWLIAAAASWWVLGQLASVLRPLLVAVFLGYVLMPYYARLRRAVPGPVAVTLMAGATTAVLMGLALTVYGSLAGLAEEVPELRTRAIELTRRGMDLVNRNLPIETPQGAWGGRTPEEQLADLAAEATFRLVNVAGGALLEAAAASLYLLFLLLESARFPQRVRAAYTPERAEHILHVFGRINAAIVSYLKAKVLASLLLAAPVGLVLAACGVRFSLLWAVVTFLCNFVPYLGTVVAFSLPVGFAFLQFDVGYRSVTAAALLLVCHTATATVVEPMVIGRAVGLSPLVILAALSVWGLLWGLPGMLLAIPLTVVLKIVFENIESTRPVARLLSGE